MTVLRRALVPALAATAAAVSLVALGEPVGAAPAPFAARAAAVPAALPATGLPSAVAGRAVVAPAALTPILNIRLTTHLVTSGLVAPVLVTSAKDGSSRLFVVEQAGRIRTVENGVITGTFLDIRGLVRSGNEQGMLGLAFDPQFVTTPRFWVTYTRADGALVLARYTAPSAASPTANPTGAVVLVVPHPTFANHNGGYIGFGKDGYLYLGTGDGGSGGDPRNNAQNLRSLLGKMLRIDVRCAGHAYCVPPTNPFVRSTRARHEIWMYGFRNPWRWSFDTNGAQWIGDVGQSRYEEVDVTVPSSAAGRNLGWSCREGFAVYRAARCSSRVAYTPPVLVLCHADAVAGCRASKSAEALIGGFVYRGAAYPGLRGTYIMGDFITGRIWPFKNKIHGSPTILRQVSGFGIDDAHELYAVTLSGALVRIGYRVV